VSIVGIYKARAGTTSVAVNTDCACHRKPVCPLQSELCHILSALRVGLCSHAAAVNEHRCCRMKHLNIGCGPCADHYMLFCGLSCSCSTQKTSFT